MNRLNEILNMCIEYQGRQHYQPWHTGEQATKLLIRQKHDQIKRDYCEKNRILLLEIKYTENIERKFRLKGNELNLLKVF